MNITPVPHLPELSTRSSRQLLWRLLMPKLAVLLLVGMIGSLLWVLQRNEADEQRQQLIADLLWIEQNFRFTLSRNEEQLQQLALDLGHSKNPQATFDLNIRHLLKNGPELSEVRWLNRRGRMQQRLPSPASSQSVPLSAPEQEFFDSVRQLAHPRYSPPRFVAGSYRFDLHIPIYDATGFSGMLIASYDPADLMKHLVPWWFTQKYQLRLLDAQDVELAGASRISTEQASELRHQVDLDPPGYGLRLESVAHASETNIPLRLYGAAIVVLAAIVLWTLWSIRRHIQKRLAAEQALQEAHAFRKAMEDSLIVGMRARDLDGRITYVNAAFCRMVGYRPEELVGLLPPMPYWDPDHREEHEAQSAQVLAGEATPAGMEARLRHRDGRAVYTKFYATPLIDAQGRQTGWISAVFDITEQKRIESLQRQQQEQLEQTARLVTMGEMASTLAHELNQPLAAIATYAAGSLHLLQEERRLTADKSPQQGFFDTLTQALTKLEQQAQRAGRIIRRVHDFVRKSEPKRRPCRLEDVIEDSLGFIEAETHKRDIRIEKSIPPHLPAVLADRLMLEQVLLNLLRNAIEAMEQTPPYQRQLHIDVSCEAGELTVRISDRGHGIDPDIATQLFTPFFTTKPQGMGMGLAICRTIIEFHHGQLRATANPAGGSTFIITLPVEEA